MQPYNCSVSKEHGYRQASRKSVIIFYAPLLSLLFLVASGYSIAARPSRKALQLRSLIGNATDRETKAFPVFLNKVGDFQSSIRDARHPKRSPRSKQAIHGYYSGVKPNYKGGGQFLMPIQFGTPPQQTLVIVDTGSSLLWLQCLPCDKCEPQLIPSIFDPYISTSYKVLPCTSSQCLTSQNNFSLSPACTGAAAEVCQYNYTYEDLSFSTGELSLETVTTRSTTGSSTNLQNIIFGCGHDNEGIELKQLASGMMGLNNSPLSFASQINVKVFSYCFPSRITQYNSSGIVMFGVSGLSGHLRYTPLIPNKVLSYLSQFYYINVTGISVDDELLPIPSDVFQIRDGGKGGTIIDSGTAYTELIEPAYSLLRAAFRNKTTHLTAVSGNEAFDTCYNVPATADWPPPRIPVVTFHLQGNVNLHLPPDNVLTIWKMDEMYTTLCLAFFTAGSFETGESNIFGNNQHQNFAMEYDIANSRIGFAAADCTWQ